MPAPNFLLEGKIYDFVWIQTAYLLLHALLK